MKGRKRKGLRVPAAVLAASVMPSALAEPTPVYRLLRPGFTDAEHTGPYGQHSSHALGINAAGWAIGLSDRYGPKDDLGHTAWLFDGSATTRIGFIGEEYTRSDGRRQSAPIAENARGDVLGFSERWDGMVYAGQAVWLHRDGKSVRLGLFDAAHTGSHDYGPSALNQDSRARGLNAVGQIIGYSERYDYGQIIGYSAWLWSDGQLTTLGLSDTQHANESGFNWSRPVALNAKGRVIGHTLFSPDCGPTGNSAWLYDGGSTMPIGLFDELHSDPVCNQHNSTAIDLNDAGDVVGWSVKYSPPAGASAWLRRGGATIRIGLLDPEHAPDGLDYSQPTAISAAGDVIGWTDQPIENSYDGQSAWVYTNGDTIRLGLIDAEHTADNGRRESFITAQSDAGHVIGWSRLYTRGGGESAWTWSDGTLTRLGYYDARHTGSDGFRKSEAIAVNEHGLVAGYSTRSVAGFAGFRVTGWVYDAATQEMIPMLPPEDEERIYPIPLAVAEDDEVLGFYGTAQGGFAGPRRYFRCSRVKGFEDFGSLVSGGVSGAGWSILGQSYRWPAAAFSGGGVVVGIGETPTTDSGEVFFLAPTIRADLNGDCAVDLADLGVLLDGYAQPASVGTGDLNEDGLIDTADLGLLLTAFGDACD